MKTTVKFLTLTLSIFLFLNPNHSKAQCNNNDWNALKALYESTNGDNWANRTGWETVLGSSPPANCNLSNLFGITTNNGRVTCIDLDGEDNCNYSVTQGNNLVGSLPSELGNLTSLTHLRLSNNQLTGNFPIELQNLSNLTHLILESNQFTGSIPPEIGNFQNLQIARLAHNQFTGNLPDEIGDLSNLDQLWLDNNQFNGAIPASIGNLTELLYLSLDDNQFSGSIPAEIGNLDNLLQLSISNTNINHIPPQIENLTSLEALYLSNTQLPQGNIPSQIWNLTNLGNLSLQNNNFIGSIPPEIGNLTNLENFSVRHNNLSGAIPASFGNLTQLKSVTFSDNNFQGSILDIVTNFPNLEIFQASSNQFTGIIPSSIGNLTQLKEISLFNNNFSGILPPELGNLDQLTLITLGQNQFEGCYPNSMSNYCDLDVWTNGNFWMSDENNFDADWEDFCATDEGICGPICGCTDPTACNYNPNANCDDGNCQPNCPSNNVYPGDFNHDGIVDFVDVSLSRLFHYSSGSARTPEHQNTDWYPHPANNWGILNNQNNDLKHHDSNGDGVINENDEQVVKDNMGLTWKTPDPSEEAPPESDYQVLLHPVDQVFDGYLVMNVALEKKSGGDLTLFSGHFVVDYSDIDADFENVLLNFEPISWLGVPFDNLEYSSEYFPAEQKIEVGFTKTDGTNSTGKGVIGRLILNYDNSLARSAGASNNTFQFEVKTIAVHDKDANTTLIEDQNFSLNVGTCNCQANLNITESTPFCNAYQSTGTITTNGFHVIGEAQQVSMQGNRVRLNSGFRVTAGAQFSAAYGNCN